MRGKVHLKIGQLRWVYATWQLWVSLWTKRLEIWFECQTSQARWAGVTLLGLTSFGNGTSGPCDPSQGTAGLWDPSRVLAAFSAVGMCVYCLWGWQGPSLSKQRQRACYEGFHTTCIPSTTMVTRHRRSHPISGYTITDLVSENDGACIASSRLQSILSCCYTSWDYCEQSKTEHPAPQKVWSTIIIKTKAFERTDRNNDPKI